jgi:SAM-dependent methyltransferase
VAEPWYAEFFDEDYLRYYTAGLTPELTAHEVDFILEKLALPPGAKILDLCCGHGRHSIELARRGCVVTGLDLSEPALRKAADSADAAGLSVRWIQADMRKIPFEGEFDAVINWFSAFGYLENDEEDQKVLDAVALALRPGGKFFIDTINHAWVMRNFAPRSWVATPEGGMILEERRFEPLSGRNVVTVTFLGPAGERIVTGFTVRIYTLAELARMLLNSGLQVCETWGNVDGSPYSLTTSRMIALSEK